MYATFSVMFRKAQFPVIVFTGTQILAAEAAAELAGLLLSFPRRSSLPHTKIINPSGEEFWFNSQPAVLAPGFTFKRWTKKQIVTELCDLLS